MKLIIYCKTDPKPLLGGRCKCVILKVKGYLLGCIMVPGNVLLNTIRCPGAMPHNFLYFDKSGTRMPESVKSNIGVMKV